MEGEKATNGTIWAAVGRGPAPNYSPTRLTAQSSANFVMILEKVRGRPLFLDELGGGLTKIHPATTADSVEELPGERATNLALQDSLDIYS